MGILKRKPSLALLRNLYSIHICECLQLDIIIVEKFLSLFNLDLDICNRFGTVMAKVGVIYKLSKPWVLLL